MTDTHDTLNQLDAVLAKIKGYGDPRRAQAEWKQAYNLLKKTSAAGNHLDNIILRRDALELAQLIDGLRAAAAGSPAADPGAGIEIDTLKSALKAFKKRLKVQRLDDESRVDPRDPMSKGEASEIAAIQPPRDWPHEVWEELARRGVLRRAGPGLYEFVAEL